MTKTGLTQSAVLLILLIAVRAVGNLHVFKVSVGETCLCVFGLVFGVHLLNVFFCCCVIVGNPQAPDDFNGYC